MSYGEELIEPLVSPSHGAAQEQSSFCQDRYMVRRKVLKLLGGAFHIYDESGRVVMYANMKAFKLREDIRLYSDDTRQVELLKISARNIIDFSATYDVIDSGTGQTVGSLRRRGMKSMLRDHWLVFDEAEQPVGELIEDSMGLALLRRFLSNLIPQRFDWRINDETVCTFHQHFNPFVLKLDVNFNAGSGETIEVDRRLGLAAAVLLGAIEGRQQ